MDLFGLTHIQQGFERDLASGRVKHAYLFVGPEHVGKTSLVTWMAQKLQCPNGGCLQCQVCLQVANGTHADTAFHLDDGETLPVETVREIIIRANRTFVSRHLVTVIENIDRLSRSGLNALLKTLEEPFESVVFLLTARHTRFIPATILSRVSVQSATGGTPETLSAYLRLKYPDRSSEELDRVRHMGLGHVGECITLLSDPDEYERRAILMRSVASLLDANVSDRLMGLSAIADGKEGKDASMELLHILSYLERERLVGSVTEPTVSISRLELLQDSVSLLSRNVDPRLVLSQVALHY